MSEWISKKGWIKNYFIQISKSDFKNVFFLLVVDFVSFLREFYSFIISNDNPAFKFLKFQIYLGICFLVVGE